MNLKLVGSICVIACCGSIGFMSALQYRKRIKFLSILSSMIEYMECELRFRCTPLPELCRQAGICGSGDIYRIFIELADELDTQISPEVNLSMRAVLEKHNDLDFMETDMLMTLGRTLGRFDLAGQLEGLENAKNICQAKLEQLMCNKESRLRSYQTLGLCAGAAVAILLV